MKLFETAALAASAVNIALTLFVLRSAVGTRLRVAYLFWGGGVATWNIGVFFLCGSISPERALVWAKILHLGIIIAPIGLFQLAFLISQHRISPVFMRSIYVLHTIFALSLFGDWYVSGVKLTPYGYWAQAGPLFLVYMMSYGVLTTTPMVRMWSAQRKARGLSRTRLRALLIAIALIWVAGTNDLLPIIGIDTYPFFPNVHFYPFGSVMAVIYVTIVGYGTLQHQLLDVRVTMGRAAAYLLRIGFIFMIGLCLLLVLAAFRPAEFRSYAFFSCQAVLLMSAIITSVLFPRLFGQSGETLERRILGDRFEYHDQIRSFIASMQWYSDTNLLLGDLHDLLFKTVRVRSYQIILLDETARVFSLFRSFPDQGEKQLPELHTDSPIFRFFKSADREYLAFNLQYGTPGAGALEQESRESLKHFNAEFCFPFHSDDEPFGLMLIGEKINHDPYTATDISLMVSLVKNLNLMINQIRLKNQIQHAQELELLGRMSRGMAHDLNNLLTPIWTLLQLVNEGVSNEDLSDELLPVALRNIKSMRAYIRESLFFSENLRPDFQLGRLDMQITQAVDITAARRAAKQVSMAVDTPGEVLVEMDEVLIQRMIANIIANAIDASPSNSVIRVELVRLVKTEMHRDWLRVRVVDFGEGIKKENLNRIFTPFFTTKDRGDKDRGFGLGLAICRKIVNLHGGNLNVLSQVGKGTTVQIDLPSRQNRPAPQPVVTS